MKEHASMQVWLFDDPDVDNRWVVYLVDHIDSDVVKAHVIAAANSLSDDYGSWLCFQHGSWIDQHSKRIV